jgi:hypothetical protein
VCFGDSDVKRRLLNLATLLSLLLFFGVAVQWARSLWWADAYSHAGESRCWTFISYRGLVRVTLYEDGHVRHRGWFGDTWPAGPSGSGLWAELALCDPAWPRMGVGYHESRTDTDSGWRYGGRRYRSWIVPYWLLAAATATPAVAGAARAARLLRARRCAARGRCASCGYDLRATPGKCPECGTPADTPSAP